MLGDQLYPGLCERLLRGPDSGAQGRRCPPSEEGDGTRQRATCAYLVVPLSTWRAGIAWGCVSRARGAFRKVGRGASEASEMDWPHEEEPARLAKELGP